MAEDHDQTDAGTETPETQNDGQGEQGERRFARAKPAFNIPAPNPIRGNNITIEMNSPFARLLTTVLRETDLSKPEDAPIYAFLKNMQRYYAEIAAERARSGHVVALPNRRPASPAVSGG